MFWLVSYADEYRLQFFDDSDGLSHWHTSRTVQDSTGFMWIATWNGLNRFDGTRFVTFKTNAGDSISTPSDKLRRITLTEDNNLICVVEDSMYLFNTRTCTFDTLSREKKEEMRDSLRVKHNPDLLIPKDIYTQLGNLQLRNIRYDYIDNALNHWLVDDHGLYVATPVVPRGKKINGEEIRYMKQLANGDLWAAIRYTDQVVVYDSDLRLREQRDLGSPVYCMYQTPDEHIWLGTKPGNLIELNGLQRREYPVRNVYDIHLDLNGRLWLASFGFGVWVSEEAEDGQAREFHQVPGTENLFVRRLLLINEDTLMAATTTGLLVIGQNVTLHQRQAAYPNSLSSNAVMSLAQYDDFLYIGTEGGGLNVIRMDDIAADKWHFEHLTMEDGLPSDIIYEIAPWNDNTLLLQGNSALTLLNKDNGQMVNFGSSFFNYPEDKRLIMGEVPPLWINDTALLFAPADGLLLIHPEDLQPDRLPVRIAISAIQLSREKINYAVDSISQITLDPRERTIRILFSALDYRYCGHILYRSRLYKKGAVVPEWSSATATAEINIPDLQPGTYIFDICSTNAYGHWQDNTRTITIVVKPTFLESTWGKTIILLLALAVILTITIILLTMREHKRKRQEALEAYLELQERLAKQSNASEPLPLPEVMVPGYLSQNEQFVQTLTAFMEANMSNSEVSIDDLMEATHMSHSSLNRKMHELFNLSPKDFLQEARIKHACSLLKQTDMPIKEIAYACGFSNQQYFATCFKSSMGVTPSEYR